MKEIRKGLEFVSRTLENPSAIIFPIISNKSAIMLY